MLRHIYSAQCNNDSITNLSFSCSGFCLSFSLLFSWSTDSIPFIHGSNRFRLFFFRIRTRAIFIWCCDRTFGCSSSLESGKEFVYSFSFAGDQVSTQIFKLSSCSHVIKSKPDRSVHVYTHHIPTQTLHIFPYHHTLGFC